MEYHILGKGFADILKPNGVSEYIKWSDGFVCVAEINYEESEKVFTKNENSGFKTDYWFSGFYNETKVIKNANINDIKEIGLFNWIEGEFNYCAINAVTSIIKGLCEYFKITPIELFNKLAE